MHLNDPGLFVQAIFPGLYWFKRTKLLLKLRDNRVKHREKERVKAREIDEAWDSEMVGDVSALQKQWNRQPNPQDIRVFNRVAHTELLALN